MDGHSTSEIIKIQWAEWRRRERLTQRECAEACGKSRSTAQRWDDVTTPYLPTVGQLAKICDAYRIDLADALRFLMGR